MRVPTRLHRGVGGFARRRCGGEIDLGEDAVGRDGDLGEGFGGECRFIDNDFLDGAVGWLRPGGSERCHCCLVWWW